MANRILMRLFAVALVLLPPLSSSEAKVGDRDCSPALRELIRWPYSAIGGSRDEAVGQIGLGMPRSVSVEVGENRHSRGDGFIPLVRYRLHWRAARLVFLQGAAGGRELLEEVVLDEPLPSREFPVAFGSAPRVAKDILGEPDEASGERLLYLCHNELGADELAFSYRESMLTQIRWQFFID